MKNVLCMQFFMFFFLKGKNHTDDVQVSKNVSNLMHLALQGYTQLALV